MMVFLGGVVGGFLIAMYLPIFSHRRCHQVAPPVPADRRASPSCGSS